MSAVTRLRHLAGQAWLRLTARSTGVYWEQRYRFGMTSGAGSEGLLARYKAGVLNQFVRDENVGAVIEFGCGDGSQLALAEYRRYLGIDLSARAIELCRQRFRGDTSKTFLQYAPASGGLGAFLQADLALSLDVVYHLIEDELYAAYLNDLFASSRRHVVVYSSNSDAPSPARHVRHRRFVDDVARTWPQFELTRRLPNPHRNLTFAEFYFFEARASITRI